MTPGRRQVALAPVRALLRGQLKAPGRRRGAGALSGAGPRRLHATLVAIEVALAVLLVAGGTMFTRSVSRLYAIDTGFDARDVAVMYVVAPTQQMAAPARAALFAQVLDRLPTVPGVAAAGLTTRVPLRDGGWQGTVTMEDRPDLAGAQEPNALFRIVSPGYFTAMGIATEQGRSFTDGDGGGTPPVAMVSAASRPTDVAGAGSDRMLIFYIRTMIYFILHPDLCQRSTYPSSLPCI